MTPHISPIVPGYSSAASLTLIVLDYIQTVDIEARVIWPADWSVVKCLFLLNRYLPLIFMPLPLLYDNSQYFSPTVCKVIHRVMAVGIPLFMATAEAFLYIRTYALSHKSRHFTIFLCINAFTIPIGFGLYQLHISRGNYVPTPGMRTGSCMFVDRGHVFLMISAILIVYNGVLTASLCLWFGFRHHWLSMENRLVQIIYRDGIFYLIIIALMSVLNGIILPVAAPQLSPVTTVPQAVLHAVLASRMLLHLRNESTASLRLPTMATSCIGQEFPHSLEFKHSFTRGSEWQHQTEVKDEDDQVETRGLETP